MAKIIKEISCIVGEYVNAKGEKQNRRLRIGSIIDTKNGPMLKLDSIPIRDGGWDGWAYMNDPKPVEGREQPRRQASGFDDMESDVPF